MKNAGRPCNLPSWISEKSIFQLKRNDEISSFILEASKNRYNYSNNVYILRQME